MNNINLDDENSIFTYLLASETNDNKTDYIVAVNKLFKSIELHFQKKEICDLVDNNNIFNIDSIWINDKYKELIKHQICADLITNNIIDFMKKN
tara:strand:+ start:132 stop:413 length:282 start_codon:yes stop_codon:yes gene_type:complete